MKQKVQRRFLSFRSDNLKSKIQNLKWVGCLAIVVMLAGWVRIAEAQQPKKLPRIGYLSMRSGPAEREAAFTKGLRELGWIDGQNLVIEYRWAKGKSELLPELATELARLKVEVIVAAASVAVQAAKNATTTIPIVMSPAGDPVGSRFIADLAQPGGNLTGLSFMGPELAGKRLELLREVLPKLARVAFLGYKSDPATDLFIKEAQDAARKLKLQLQPFIVANADEFDETFSTMKKQGAGALVVQPILVTIVDQNRRIVELAIRNRLPAISDLKDFADAGGLMSYGPNVLALYQRAAYFVDKILKGSKPAELPVEQPRIFETAINLKTAKQIGVTISPEILSRADKVIK
jgi:putative tryptophan/tyrosine transport system substrate-binding protein